jgi:hypothetical protein
MLWIWSDNLALHERMLWGTRFLDTCVASTLLLT